MNSDCSSHLFFSGGPREAGAIDYALEHFVPTRLADVGTSLGAAIEEGWESAEEMLGDLNGFENHAPAGTRLAFLWADTMCGDYVRVLMLDGEKEIQQGQLVFPEPTLPGWIAQGGWK